jgi:chitodextrinase
MFIRRRPSVATIVAVFATLAVGSQTGLAAGSSQGAPDPVSALEVTATDATSVTVAWPAVRDRDVAGYTVFLNGAQVGIQTLDQVKRWRERDSFTYTLPRLACGTGYTVGVDTFDRDEHHSKPTTTTVSTSACPDATPPSAPSGMRQVAATETSVVLAWTPSSDNVGVVEYGLSASGVRVSTVSDANATLSSLKCGTSYLIAIDAADAAGNRSAQASSFFRTSACPSTNKPPSTPTLVRVAQTSQTSIGLSWTASTDDVGVTGYGLYLAGSRISETTALTGSFTGLECGKTYTLGVDAKDAGGLRSAIASVSAATSPCSPPPSSSGKVTQTIVNGSTITNIKDWRAVYDANGDGKEDDPGSIQFLIDGTQVLSEINAPFGDTFANGTLTTTNGQHTFQVRALNDTGTLLATNTITATVATPTPAPTADTIAPSQPGNLKVSSASATGVAIAWNAATDNVGVAGYDLYRSSSRVGTTQRTTASFSGLTCGTGYPVAVDAFDAAGNTSPSSNMTVTTSACADSQPPAAPTNVIATTRTATSIALSWAPATDNVGVAGYGVYNGANLVQTTAGTTGIVTNLTCNTNYTLAVDAFDATGNSSTKTTIMVSTQPCTDTTAPSQPTNLRATGTTQTSLTLTWNASTDAVGVTGYEVFKAGTKAASPTTTTTTLAGLACGTTYSVGVRALDAAGNASLQTTASFTTAACLTTTSIGYPDASNTGVPSGTTLTAYTGPSNISTPNTVIDGKTIGCLQVSAPGVVIRNSRISCPGGGVYVDDRSFDDTKTPLLIEDSEISCQNQGGTGINEADFIVRRSEITGCENGFSLNQNVLIEDSYIHNLTIGGHEDGIQIAAGYWDGSNWAYNGGRNITIRHNTIYGMGNNDTTFGTSAIIGGPEGTTNVLIESNLLAGGAYTLYCVRGATPTNYRVVNNRFTTRFKSSVGAYGWSSECSDEIQSGNTIYETGQPITLG